MGPLSHQADSARGVEKVTSSKSRGGLRWGRPVRRSDVWPEEGPLISVARTGALVTKWDDPPPFAACSGLVLNELEESRTLPQGLDDMFLLRSQCELFHNVNVFNHILQAFWNLGIPTCVFLTFEAYWAQQVNEADQSST